ncbi:sulfurtransferase [Cellulophaga sp. Hel_I_12]|uniref:sulfurtransferase n=1 Tax=Cellulophaga sp. Hel_I_12 TaxID=1249972 RepID=UPI000646F9A2|nr:sulfurtransferase [Cellulophaga sp. Hel_I_12]
MEPVVTSKWLYKHINDPDLLILDASLADPISGEISKFADKCIPGARFFDLKNNFSDKKSPYPNMLPKPEDFQRACRKLGINASSKLIIYDNLGVYSSPRVWWMFKAMGHSNVAVLDGGLPDWIANGYPIEAIHNIKKITPGTFEAHYKKALVVDFEMITSNINEQKALVVDARSEGRFKGTAPEPRAELKSGHIPNSVNIPYETVLENGKFKKASDLALIFDKELYAEQPLIFSCGSGLTACIILLASELVLSNQKAVYDGSWTEWTQKMN